MWYVHLYPVPCIQLLPIMSNIPGSRSWIPSGSWWRPSPCPDPPRPRRGWNGWLDFWIKWKRGKCFFKNFLKKWKRGKCLSRFSWKNRIIKPQSGRWTTGPRTFEPCRSEGCRSPEWEGERDKLEIVNTKFQSMACCVFQNFKPRASILGAKWWLSPWCCSAQSCSRRGRSARRWSIWLKIIENKTRGKLCRSL